MSGSLRARYSARATLIPAEIGSGETGRTTGHLSVDNEYNDFLVSTENPMLVVLVDLN